MINNHLKNKFCIRELIYDEEQAKNNLLICPICQMVLIQPKECQKCQNLFCTECLLSWQLKSTSCPYKCQDPKFQEPHRFIKNALSNIQLKCPNFKKGCREKFNQENIEFHYAKCQYSQQENEEDPNFELLAYCHVCQVHYNQEIVHNCMKQQNLINELEKNQMILIESHQQMVESYEQKLIQKEEEIYNLKNQLILQKYYCHKDHKLIWCEDQKGQCRLCLKENSLFHFRCKQCRIDYCNSCLPLYILNNRCPNDHKFKINLNPDQDQQCDSCFKYPSLKGQASWRDEKCNFELCADCFNLLKK